jgi:hypothetical protein
MRVYRFVLFSLLLSSPGLLRAQLALTHPFIQVNSNLSWLHGTAVDLNPLPGIGAGLGMWSIEKGKLEWMMIAQYQLLRAETQGYRLDGRTVIDSSIVSLTAHQLDWTTLAVYHFNKPGFNLQAGVWVGVGLGGNLQDDLISLGEPGGVPTSLLHESGQLGYGTVLGLGIGWRYTQFNLRYVWDARDRDPNPLLRVRRSALQLGVAFLLRDFVIF